MKGFPIVKCKWGGKQTCFFITKKISMYGRVSLL